MAKIKGSEALIKIFQGEGVKYIFGLPGSTEGEYLDSLEDNPDIKYILCLHENIAVCMAQGYSRTTRKVGVVLLHTNIGLASGLPMLINAYYAGVPLLVTAGQQDTRIALQEPAMADDLAGMVRRYTKWTYNIQYVEDIPLAIQRAFKVALQPPTGPVFISLPMNIMSDTLDFEYVTHSPVFSRIRPDREAIARAVELLSEAQNPAILVGAGVDKNEAINEVVKLAELTGARVYQRMMSDVNFPTNHPLYMGNLDVTNSATRDLLKSVDVLTAIGEPLITYLFYLPKPLITGNTKIIQIDDNPWEIAKNFPVASGISGHIKNSLTELVDGLQSNMKKKTREAAVLRASNIARETEKMNQDILAKAQSERDQLPIAASRLILEIKDALKPGTLLVDDSISAGLAVRNIIRFSEPKSLQCHRGGGCIGEGMPAALGTKLAAPDRPVVALCGDGSAMWAIQSLWTAAHYNIPVTIIIFANKAYDLLKLNKHLVLGEKARGRYLGMDFNEPRINFCEIAQGMGVSGKRVERPEELRKVLTSAFESNKPNLVEVHVAHVSIPG